MDDDDLRAEVRRLRGEVNALKIASAAWDAGAARCSRCEAELTAAAAGESASEARVQATDLRALVLALDARTKALEVAVADARLAGCIFIVLWAVSTAVSLM